MAEETKSLATVTRQVKDFAGTLSRQQWMLLGAGALLVIGALVAFVRLGASPDMKVLYSGGDASDVQAIAARLASKNIKAELAPDGTSVSVPADQLDSARLELASQPIPRAGRLGFEIFDKPNWAATDFNEQVNYQRALEGELERTIQSMSEVKAVRVHLVMPHHSVFVDREEQAKGTVVVRLRSGRLSADSQNAIARLVAGSVEQLEPEHVTVVDADTNQAINTSTDPLFGNSQSGKSADDVLSARLVSTLEPVTGEGRVRASVRVEYDNSSSEENQETYDPNSAVALTMQRTEERNGRAGSSGVPGTASNLPNAALPTRGAGDESQSKSENGTYAVNRTVRHTVQPSGRVKRIAAALLVDDDVAIKEENGMRREVRTPRSAEQLKQIEELAKAALGIDAARGDVLTVQNLSFKAAPVENIPAPSRVDAVRRVATGWLPFIRIGALGLLFIAMYFIMLRPVKKQLLLSFRSRQLQPAQASSAALPESAPAPAIDLPESAPEVKKVVNLTKQLAERVKAEPTGATRLIQSWIRDDRSER